VHSNTSFRIGENRYLSALSLILASNSPRRQEILTAAGIAYTIRPPDIVEEPRPGERPLDYVRRLAEEKAFAIPIAKGEIVLAADTIVVLQEHILEKPRHQSDALRMLRLLSGQEHQVITGICLRAADAKVIDVAVTKVRFIPLTEREIADYASSGEPMDKAGAYAIQGQASKFIDRIEGCYFNVVGLPMSLVYLHLKKLTK
jgi:septum formation protein